MNGCENMFLDHISFKMYSNVYSVIYVEILPLLKSKESFPSFMIRFILVKYVLLCDIHSHNSLDWYLLIISEWVK